ncbi:MAG: DUF4270 family protein [Chitinophagales bacterium]|nr:DUF4270 family protein [Chitinophagales bacterium]
MATGCKEDTVIKASIAPGNDVFGTVTIPDTFTKITKTVLTDTMNTSERYSDLPILHALGSIYDPYFGKTSAGIYLQVLPPTPYFRFAGEGIDYTIDSAVLVLPYLGQAWGDSVNPDNQKFVVHELTESMDVAATYYSDRKLNMNSTPIASVTVDMKKMLNEIPAGIIDTPGNTHLRLKLNDAFKDKIRSHVVTTTFDNDANFLSVFKGFFIGPGDTNTKTNLLPYFLLNGTKNYDRAAIVFYYRDNGSTTTKVAYFSYVFDKTANYNLVIKNYTGTRAQYWINRYQSAPNVSDDTVLIQNSPGVAMDLRIPYVKNLPVASIVKAELVITKVLSGNADSLIEPNRLVPVGVDDDGNLYNIRDYNPLTSSAVAFVDGYARKEKDENNNDVIRYRINIPREVQKTITDTITGKPNELHLRIKGANGLPGFIGLPGAYRLVAAGNSGTYKVQLNIVYAKPD